MHLKIRMMMLIMLGIRLLIDLIMSQAGVKKDGYVYYYDKDGVSVKGVQKIDGKTYYFNRIDGAMETGWQIVDGKRCYFDKKKGYELFNQWIQDGDDYYFVGEDGAAKKDAMG